MTIPAPSPSFGLPLGPFQAKRHKSGYAWYRQEELDRRDFAEMFPWSSDPPNLGRRKSTDDFRGLAPIDESAGFESVPLKDPALCRIFGRLDGSEEAILRFANEYGPIKDYWPRRHWQSGIASMDLVLDIAECALDEDGDPEELARWFKRRKPGWLVIDHKDARHPLGGIGPIKFDLHGEDANPRMRGYLLRWVAFAFLQQIINSNLKDELRTGVLTPLNMGRVDGPLSLEVVPSSLHGALWLQAAQAACGEHEFRQCGMCSRWFTISTEARRSHSVYCQDSCKSKHYRLRKRQAKALREGGMSPSEIAKELGSDTDTVRGWLGMSPLKR